MEIDDRGPRTTGLALLATADHRPPTAGLALLSTTVRFGY
jgi:hypothetical protein